jgi:hypothetical protein
MGKLIVPLLIGLLMGISGGGFFAVYKASAAHATAVLDARKHGLKPVADSTRLAEGDSSAHGDGEHAATEPTAGEHASAEPTAATHDSTPAAVAAAHAEPAHGAAVEHATEPHSTLPGTKSVAAGAGAATAAAAHGSAAPTATPVTPASSAASPGAAPTVAEAEAHQRRLAKIFATMSAKDASRVLTQMTDHDVSIILGLLSDRQAAAILISLPAPRAAALSQLQPRRAGGAQ